MSYRSVVYLLGLLIAILGLTMLVPLGWSLYFADGQAGAFGLSIGACLGVGGLAFLFTRRNRGDVFRREGLAVVGLGWLLAAAFGALPFVFSGTLPAYYDAYFESMSGFTTTGSTVLTNIEATAPSVLFWRSQTHWLGGMGIIVLFLAVLPYLGVSGKQLFKSEVPGPVPEGLRPRIAETASILWKIYVGLSAIETILLMVEGMDLFEALIHTFGTMATGGFSSRNASIAAYDSVAIEVTIIAFMILAGTNFALYYRVLRGERWALFKDAEWRVYAFLLLAATAFVSVHLLVTDTVAGTGEAVRQASFQVTSLMTTTGYGTADFNLWPVATKVLLVALMFVGGSAGSTGGGMKVIRIVLLVKLGVHAVRKTFSPATVRPIRIGGTVIDGAVRDATLSFYLIFTGIAVVATFLVALTGPDLVTSTTAVVATLNNIGPGLGKVGAVENFAFLHPFAKTVCSLCMALGRLELFAILALFSPSLWRRV